MVAFLVALLACSSSEPQIKKGDTARPDVIMVSIDTLRADHLSSYGHHRPTSPFLDRLASEGTRFDHARSNSPWTLPAHLTMLTGQLPVTHQVTDDHLALDPSVRVLPEAMVEAGYATGASVATLYVSRKFGFDRGFDFFDDHGIDNEKKNLRGEVVATDIIGEAVEWIESLEEGKPFYLFLHFYDVHYHYDPPPPFDTMFDRAPAKSDRRFTNYYRHKKKPLTKKQKAHQLAQYDESIAYVDAQLGGLYDALDKAGRKQRCLLVASHPRNCAASPWEQPPPSADAPAAPELSVAFLPVPLLQGSGSNSLPRPYRPFPGTSLCSCCLAGHSLRCFAGHSRNAFLVVV